ncbi:MAG: pentapeptide repeat-containing protein [Nostoc sp.]|uniref:pentapeptide repeat-containing protein n=1 Tax=Nostoc sp. TaxID=1180 RepID=UPI002FF88E22
MAMTKLWKFLRNIQDLNWGQSVEVTKTGAEAAKAVLDLAKAIKEQKPNVQNFKPYVEQISSLLDVFNSPLGQITKEVIPFAPIAITILKFIIDATNKEPSLENCVLLVSQAAYIDSFQDILKQDSELLQKIDQNREASETLAFQIHKLGEQEFDEREVKKAILYFHESQLAESFNQILQQRLQEAGLSEAEAKTFTERVARHTDENMQDALVEVGEKADKLWKWYSAGGKEKLEKNLNIEDYLQHVDFVTSDSGWLTDKNTRFLFLLDGFDELLLEGRASGGLKEFLEQVEQFQKDRLCHHQFLITGRPLALQGIERLLSQTKSLKRVELQPMDDSLQQKWLEKWAIAAQVNKSEFEKFLQACPDEVKNKLAREPLLLYLLARMHRENRLNVQMFAGTDAIKAKIRIYDESVKWVLEKQRNSENQNDNSRLTGLESEDLRQFLTEAALCVVQSGNESARVTMLEARLKDSNNPAAKLIQDARQENTSEKNQQDKLLNNLLTAFYIKPASGDKGGSVEFVHKSFSEFLFAERLLKSFVDWITKVNKRDFITTEVMDKQIYDLFGYGNLTPEIIEYLMGLLAESSEFHDVERLCQLFRRLEDFYFRWCDGEFIDAEDANLPLIKKKQLREQLPERENQLGLRQVDVCTGLNVMILLLELHRYAQQRDELKNKIVFYPCGQKNQEGFDRNRLLRIINYSNCITVAEFPFKVGQFLSKVNLSDADLRQIDFSGADLNGADLSGAYLYLADFGMVDLSYADLSYADLLDASFGEYANLSGINLTNANLIYTYLAQTNLKGSNLKGANLSNAILNEADLSDADLSDADLSAANLSDANLNNANLSNANFSRANLEAVVWNSDTKWFNAKGLHEAVGVSPELSQDKAFAAAVSLSQGFSWVREGKIKEAQEAFKQAQILDQSLRNSAEFWNSICWVGCLHGYAQGVFKICEKAVTLDPDNKASQDSRGLARVLTGDLVGALEDFQAVVDSGALNYSNDVKQRRLRWIEALKSGNNPLTPEELEKLRQVEG